MLCVSVVPVCMFTVLQTRRAVEGDVTMPCRLCAHESGNHVYVFASPMDMEHYRVQIKF